MELYQFSHGGFIYIFRAFQSSLADTCFFVVPAVFLLSTTTQNRTFTFHHVLSSFIIHTISYPIPRRPCALLPYYLPGQRSARLQPLAIPQATSEASTDRSQPSPTHLPPTRRSVRWIHFHLLLYCSHPIDSTINTRRDQQPALGARNRKTRCHRRGRTSRSIQKKVRGHGLYG